MSDKVNNNIALLIPNLACGGAERVMLTLAHGFLSCGYQVNLLLLRREGELLELVPPEVNLVVFNARKPRQVILPLAYWLRKYRPAVLLSSLSQLAWVSSLACRFSGVDIRLVCREENTLTSVLKNMNSLSADLRLWLLRSFCGEAEFVCVSDGAATDLKKNIRRANAVVYSIPNPVIDEQFYQRAKIKVEHTWFYEEGIKVILAVGRLHIQKGFDVLLKAFSKVYSNRQDVRLLIMGEGPDRAFLEQQRDKLGLREVVDMPGFVANPLPYMTNADLFVFSSRWEGLGNALIEALACGVKVVATDCPNGPREILENGRYGELVPPDDPEALAVAMMRALRTRKSLSVSFRWLERYSVKQVVSRHLEVMGLK